MNCQQRMNHLIESISTATSLLHENKNSLAIHLLGQTLRQLLAQPRTLSGEGHLQDSKAHSFRIYAIDTPSIHNELTVSPDNSYVFYPRAFGAMPLEATNPMEMTTKYSNQFLGIIMYNIALGYHREGLLRGSSKLLRKALTMYLPAFAVSQQCPLGGLKRSLMMAITNNMGHIHSIHFDSEKVKEYHIYMTELIHESLLCAEAPEEQEILSFFVGSSVLSSSGPCSAPAA